MHPYKREKPINWDFALISNLISFCNNGNDE
jgi:hypothetical protein